MIELRSDNSAGVAPEIIAALSHANDGTAMAYGGDEITERLETQVRALFEHDGARIFPITSGTAGNAIGLSALTPPWGAVVCHPTAHIVSNEPGSTSLFAGGAQMLHVGGGRYLIDPDELRVRGWSTPDTALCLMVDRSGSMGGKPLATNAVAASAVAWRAPDDYSVLTFGKEVVAAKSQDHTKSNEAVVDSVLALRGFGTTDVARALSAAQDQLSRSNAGRKVTVLLSDCRATVEGDAFGAASRLDELVIIAPESDSDEAEFLARMTGARLTTVSGPSDAAAALNRVLDD